MSTYSKKTIDNSYYSVSHILKKYRHLSTATIKK